MAQPLVDANSQYHEFAGTTKAAKTTYQSQKAFKFVDPFSRRMTTMKKVIDNMPSQRSHRVCDIQAYNDYYLAYFGHITRYESQRKLVSFSTPHAMCASVPDVMSRLVHGKS